MAVIMRHGHATASVRLASRAAHISGWFDARNALTAEAISIAADKLSIPPLYILYYYNINNRIGLSKENPTLPNSVVTGLFRRTI